VALQPQPAGAVTVIDPLPPPAATDCDAGAMVIVQVMPDCVTL
jgi:hypothetical protein